MSRRDSGIASGLREFALALARDDRFIVDQRSAEELVNRLVRQSAMVAIDGDGPGGLRAHPSADARIRQFGQFVRLYRRHMRRLAATEPEFGWEGEPTTKPPMRMVEAVRALPSELREAILIVVVGRFTYQNAAIALDLPLATLVDRLARARGRIAALSSTLVESERPDQGAGPAPYLRVVK